MYLHHRLQSRADVSGNAAAWRPEGGGGGGFLGGDVPLTWLCLFSLRPSVGFPRNPVWPFDVTEVIVDCSPLSASIFLPAELTGTTLPFIPTLIFLCDGWLSYCVICAF